MKKGFTLVELSIVLVIIGLLVGGILTAQSLIDSAKMQSFVRQMGQLDAAVASFESRYRNIPGDKAIAYPRNTFGAVSIHATEDGILTDDNRGMDTHHMLATGVDEPALFWLELALLTQFKPDNCKDIGKRIPGTDPEGVYIDGPTCNVAQAKVGNDVAIIPYAFDTNGGMPYAANTDGNAYYFYDCSASHDKQINGDCIAGITHVEALAFDSKLDDGIVSTGNILAGVKASASAPIRVNGGINIPANYDPSSTNLLVVVRKFGDN